MSDPNHAVEFEISRLAGSFRYFLSSFLLKPPPRRRAAIDSDKNVPLSRSTEEGHSDLRTTGHARRAIHTWNICIVVPISNSNQSDDRVDHRVGIQCRADDHYARVNSARLSY